MYSTLLVISTLHWNSVLRF